MKIRERLGISKRTQKLLSRTMQLFLFLIGVAGFYFQDTSLIVNSVGSLLLTFLPGLLERDYNIVMDPALVLWLTSAVFLHAAGTLGLYSSISWWDHLTHALSASVVAAAGYATVRAIDQHYDEIKLPGKYMFAFLIIFILAFGVIWELLEYVFSLIAEILGTETVLTQHGLEDTMKDLVFDMVGALIIAVAGEIYLSDLIDEIRNKIEEVMED